MKPTAPVPGQPLSIRADSNVDIGAPAALWGFPGGHYGLRPMFSAGYIAGVDGLQVAPNDFVRQLVVNAAFNRGNSGGPLVLVATGEVIGVVSSKVTGLSGESQAALNVLQNQQSGFVYNATAPDGKPITFSR